MVNLSGSYVNDEDGSLGPTGGLNVTFAGPDGRLIGGPVEGLLIAGSPVQVPLKCFCFEICCSEIFLHGCLYTIHYVSLLVEIL